MQRTFADKRRRENHVLVKGNFLNKGPAVSPAVLAAFNPGCPMGAKPRSHGAGPMVRRREQSTDRAGRGQSDMGDDLRHRHRRNPGGFRHTRPAAEQSAIARLSWPSNSAIRPLAIRIAPTVGHEANHKADRNIGGVSSIVPRHARGFGEASKKIGSYLAACRRLEAELQQVIRRWRLSGFD